MELGQATFRICSLGLTNPVGIIKTPKRVHRCHLTKFKVRFDKHSQPHCASLLRTHTGKSQSCPQTMARKPIMISFVMVDWSTTTCALMLEDEMFPRANAVLERREQSEMPTKMTKKKPKLHRLKFSYYNSKIKIQGSWLRWNSKRTMNLDQVLFWMSEIFGDFLPTLCTWSSGDRSSAERCFGIRTTPQQPQRG